MKNKSKILLLLIIILSLCSQGKVWAKEPDITEGGYSSILYDNSNGLPTSEANAIAQTSNGFIWIGSYSGLIRYDGNDFYRYDASMGISSVVSLFVDSKDRLWIGTNDSGIALYQDGEFQFYGRDDGLNSLSIRSIAEDRDGNIIIATTQGLAYIDLQNQLHILEDSQIDAEYICELKSDSDGIVYGDTLSGAFFAMEHLQLTAYYSGQELGIGVISCICPNPNEKGGLYLGTEESAVVRVNLNQDVKDYETLSVSPQVNINAISPAADGKIWVCADNGIGYLDTNSKYQELKDIPMNNSVDEMLIDYEGNLWFASSRQGVMKIVANRFTDIYKIAGLDSQVVNSTCVYQDDLYIGTDNGLSVLDRNNQPIQNVLTDLLDGIRIRCIKEDLDGNLWLCSYSEIGLVCYYGDGTYTTYNEESGLKSNRVRTMETMSDGTVAVATSGGLNLIKDGKLIATYDETDGISNTEILSVCEGDEGQIYLGSDGGGIYVLENGQISQLGVDDGLESEIILRIKKDSLRSVYWIITSNSISYLKDGVITTLTQFPYSNNFDLYFDENGGIWILSSNGIYVVNGDQLLADTELEYSFYDMKSGLPCITTANSRSCVDTEGNLYIAGSTGVVSVNINENTGEDGTVRLVVPFIEVDDTMINIQEGEEIVIPASCRRLTIYAYAITYSLQNPRLNYYLEGFDDESVSVSRQELQPVSYTNLSGGKYTFHFSVIDTMTGNEENAISVTLIKEKAFYEKAWFWVCIVIIDVLILWGCVVLYTRRKTAKLLEKQKENKIYIKQMIQAFAQTIDFKDKYTKGHSFRVAKYAGMIAKQMGYDEAEAVKVHDIGLLHDVGKITIPDEILNKPGKLSDEEYEIIKQHAANGYDILKEIEIMPELALGAGYHHERIDGKGYPSQKVGEEIPQIAQIIAVADTFDAMNSTRPYRKRMKMEDIKQELIRVSGTQLNAEIVQALLSLIDAGVLEDEC